MAEKKEESAASEKIYTVPLRKEWRPAQRIERTKKSVSAVREFVARHTHAGDIKISEKLNSVLWARGAKKPPRKIRVKVNLIEEMASVRLPEEISLDEEKKRFLEEREKKKKAKEKEAEGGAAAPPEGAKAQEGAKEERPAGGKPEEKKEAGPEEKPEEPKPEAEKAGGKSEEKKS
jgi:large subunit ribosomal protein L31e